MCDSRDRSFFERLQVIRHPDGSTSEPFLAMVSILAACGLMIALVVMFERKARA